MPNNTYAQLPYPRNLVDVPTDSLLSKLPLEGRRERPWVDTTFALPCCSFDFTYIANMAQLALLVTVSSSLALRLIAYVFLRWVGPSSEPALHLLS